MRDTTRVTTTAKSVAFETHVRSDLTRLIWFGQRIGGSLPEAEDVAQEAMRSLWEHWESVDNPAAYTRQAVRRELFRAHSKMKRAREAEAMVVTTAPDRPSAADDLFDSDVHYVLQMLRALPTAQREVFALHMDGWDTKEIVEITGQRPATVRSNLRHARQKLLKMIENETLDAAGKETTNGP